ncbi:Hpt domain-containing protein [Celeribacter litoreus]|uniref:Hpt domain-containing protein n=1 Tax=Celeribacter litoreus TaxID=2876714 RepID=UPI001CCAA277|nr:Hpt domain-containing protein [Celeribacter litoreus]MCA0042125.1 Hpt domain-containing protein [Celeribacter litoreus]
MIDWSRVEELREEVGLDDFAEVVDLFLEEVDETIKEFEAQPAGTRLEEILHFLKGSSLNLGFARFSQMCLEGEEALKRGDTSAINAAEIVATYSQSRTAFLARL